MDKSKKAKLVSELLRAIQRKEFVLYYQPQFNLFTSKFEGIEALARWQHPERGLLLPDEFIAVAEESEIIVPLGDWVLRTACQQNKKWQRQGLAELRIAVNVSGKQLQTDEFVSEVKHILEEIGLEPRYLELEMTENIIINNQSVVNRIHQLKEIGVQIALDDFGTGYSSISYLKKIPVDKIKIDQSYINNINNNNNDAAIVRAIIALAKALDLQVLAEGVESLKQLQAVMLEECREAQGFYFSEPLPADEIEKFLFLYKDKQFLK